MQALLTMPPTRLMPAGNSTTCLQPGPACAAGSCTAIAGGTAAALLLTACLRRLLPRAAVGLRPLLPLRRRLRAAAALPDECSLPQSLSLSFSRDLLLSLEPSMLLLVGLLRRAALLPSSSSEPPLLLQSLPGLLLKCRDVHTDHGSRCSSQCCNCARYSDRA